jgi:hypothetical protein
MSRFGTGLTLAERLLKGGTPDVPDGQGISWFDRGCRLIARWNASPFWCRSCGLPGAVSSSRSRQCRRMMGLRRRNLPRCQTHAAGLGLVGATGSAEWFVHVPAGTPQHASGQAHPNSPDQAVALTIRVNGSPDLSIACMMTANLRATATAARLKPIRSRNCTPHWRRSLSA